MIYYGDKDQADAILRLVVKANTEISKLFDYQPYGRFQIRLYSNIIDFQNEDRSESPDIEPKSSQVLQVYSENHHGQYSNYFREQAINTIPVYFDGSYNTFYKQLKCKMIQFYYRDMFYSSSRGSRANRNQLWIPNFIYFGSAHFLSAEISSDELSYLQSITNNEAYKLFLTNEVNSKTIPVYKSFWYYLNKTYSTKKIADAIYMMRLSRNIESGFTSSIGVSSEVLIFNWFEWYVKEYNQISGFDLASQDSPPIDPTKEKRRIVGSAVHPKKDNLAYIAEQNGKISLEIYNIKKNSIDNLTTVSTFGNYTPFRFIKLPVTYSNSGNSLAAVLPRNDEWVLYLYTNNKLNYISLREQFEVVNQLSWSPDGKNLAISATKSGKTNIYIYIISKNNFISVNNDIYDDLHPVWRSDTSVVFSSNRDTALSIKPKVDFNFVDNCFDLYEVNPFGKNKNILRISNTPFLDEIPILANYQNTIFLQNWGIVNQLFIKNKKDTLTKMITQFKQGVLDFQLQNKTGIYSGYHQGRIQFFVGDTLNTKSNFSIHTHPIIQNRIQKLNDKINNEEYRELLGETQQEDSQKSISPLDSSKQTTNVKNKKAKFYVFDDDDNQNDTSKTNRTLKKVTIFRRKFDAKQTIEETPLNINELKFNTLQLFKPSLGYQSFRIFLDWDAMFGGSIVTRFTAESPFAQHKMDLGLRGYFDRVGSDVWGNYRFSKKRTQLETGFSFMSRKFTEPQEYSYFGTELYGQVSWALSPFFRIAIKPSLVFINKNDLRLRDNINKDLNATTTGTEFNITFDNATEINSGSLRGWRIKLGGQFRQTISATTRTFAEIGGDIRKYTAIWHNKFILATRLSSGVFIGPNPKQYYIGGLSHQIIGGVENLANLANSEVAEDFYYTRFVTPVRGFSANARQGTQFASINIEFRVPFSTFNSNSKYTKNNQRSLLYLFYDIGTAWTTGNPLSQKNPIDATTVSAPPFTITVQSLKSPFMMGFGAGFRTILLGQFLQANIGWGVEDNTIQSIKFNLGLSKEF